MFTSTSEHQINECPQRVLFAERRWKSNNEVAPNCPRCASSNTKFCYYNNYSLSQPRYFCKGCRRYWTKGGSLRNVPVGGGCRKSRRSKSARQMERLGLKYQVPSPGSNSNDSDSSDGVNIDLAAVFAKFLNQDSSNNDEKVVNDHQESSSGVSSTSPEFLPPNSFESEQMENILFETDHLRPSDLTDFVDSFHDHGQGLPQLCIDDENFQELLDHNALQFQGIHGDHTGWSDGASLPNLELGNVIQFQDLGPYSIDDHTQISSTIACENWSSIYLSGYEHLPRP